MKKNSPYFVGVLCIVLGMLIDLAGLHWFGKSLLHTFQGPKEQNIYGLLNIFLGMGIVVTASLYIFHERRLRKTESKKIAVSQCPKCGTDLRASTEIGWEPLLVARCPACGVRIRPHRLGSALALSFVVLIPFLTALPVITQKVSVGHYHWPAGALIMILSPATGMWILSNACRYVIVQKEGEP